MKKTRRTAIATRLEAEKIAEISIGLQSRCNYVQKTLSEKFSESVFSS